MTAQPDIASAKQTLRAEMMQRRAGLSADDRRDEARTLAETGLDFVSVATGTSISAYAAIGEEVDPLPLLKKLHGAGHRLCLPVVVARDQPLTFRKWSPGDPLIEAGFGLRVPDDSAAEVQPDVLLVPLLAFDNRGYRLGYGGGYFDRSLAMLRANRRITAVGLAFDIQKVDDVPHDGYDERLDWILTPSGPHKFERL